MRSLGEEQMNWRIGPVVCSLLARMRQLLGANEYVSGARRGSRKTSAARRRHRELMSVIEALPDIHRTTRRPRVRHSTRSVGETTGRIMRRLTAITSHASLSAGKWCVNATSSCIPFSAGRSAGKYGCEAWDWMRQDVLMARRRLSALLLTVSARRTGKLHLEWRKLVTKPVVAAVAAVFVLVCGSLLLTQDRLVYAAVYGGQEIGVVTSRQVGDALRLQVQQDLERQWGKTVFLPAPLTYVACRAPYALLSPPGKLTEEIRSLPWMTDDGPVLVNQAPVLAMAGGSVDSKAPAQPQPRPAAIKMPRKVAYGSVSRGSGSGTLAWPVSGPITSPFGWRILWGRRNFHTGVDIGAGYGTPVEAAASGKVVLAGWDGGYGRCVLIDHGDGLATRYAHLSRIDVSLGEQVSRVEVIGNVGESGNADGPHLHFEVIINGNVQNPLRYLH